MMKDLLLTISLPMQIDSLEAGVWTSKPTKFSEFQWRLNWGFLNTITVLRQQWIQAPSHCWLYGNNPETFSHFFNCTFSKEVLITVTGLQVELDLHCGRRASPVQGLGAEATEQVIWWSPIAGKFIGFCLGQLFACLASMAREKQEDAS